MRAKAWRPEGLGAPGHCAPSPYARLAEKAPHLMQNKTCNCPVVLARVCPLTTRASAANAALGPSHRWCASAGLNSGFTDIRMQTVHRHMPALNVQLCEPSRRIVEPSRALGGLRIRSCGIGGNAWVTFAIVLTISLERRRLASSSAAMAGEG